ncbi:MAG: hypothetical protein H7A25_08585 [Leptospiraceae bacterium]|nr:hypothetical protein [Leptospiraceae bacterium]
MKGSVFIQHKQAVVNKSLSEYRPANTTEIESKQLFAEFLDFFCFILNHCPAMASDDEYFIIPNPLYDVVFRYLMEDIESARLILSTFINQKIKHIQPEPTEKVKKKGEDTQNRNSKAKDLLDLFRLDFVATIEFPDGKEEVVMIEVQKASEPGDYFRFKRYICNNFQKKKLVSEIQNEKEEPVRIYEPMRLIPIFILNFTIETEVKELFIKTRQVKQGIFKNKIIEQKSDFIENLTYELWIVQLPYLKKVTKEDYEADSYKTKLYTLLKLFDQGSILGDNKHRLKHLKTLFPDEWDRVINRLKSVLTENPDMEEEMYLEDEYLKVLEGKDNQLAAKDKIIEEKDKIIKDFARMLKNSGLTIPEISQKTGLSTEEIENL